MKTYILHSRERSAKVERVASGIYKVTSQSFERTYSGIGAEADAFIAAKLWAFHGRKPAPMLVQSGDTAIGLQAVVILRKAV